MQIEVYKNENLERILTLISLCFKREMKMQS